MLVLSKGKHASFEDHKRWGSYWIILIFLRVVVFEVFEIVPSALSTIVLLIRVLITAYMMLPQTKGSLVIWNKYLTNDEVINSVKARVAGFAGGKKQ